MTDPKNELGLDGVASADRSGAKVVLVGAGEGRRLEELGRLSETYGLEVCGVLEQNRRDAAGYLGRGKRRELRELVGKVSAALVVSDDELTASQARVLEEDAGVGVLDRTELIIRIFYSHAHDAPSKLQVELAELEYMLPRVRGMWKHLERLGGGLGSSGGAATRGPGEQQLEYDRRSIRARMEKLRERLETERSSREVRGAKLREGSTPKVALVGYTNAGKTTLLNALGGVRRSTKDRLFETLQTTTRLVSGKELPYQTDSEARPPFTLTDTVGFIQKLPTQLVESFASTLDAARQADILLLVADASSQDVEEEIQTVRNTLRETSDKPIILVLNKADLLSEVEIRELLGRHPGAVAARAVGGVGGCGEVLEKIYAEIDRMSERMEVLIPHREYSEAARLYGMARIHARQETNSGVLLDVSLPRSQTARYEPYRCRNGSANGSGRNGYASGGF